MLIFISFILLCAVLYIILTHTTSRKGFSTETPSGNRAVFYPSSTLVELPKHNAQVRFLFDKQLVEVDHAGQTFSVPEDQLVPIARTIHGVKLARNVYMDNGIERSEISIGLDDESILISEYYVRMEHGSAFSYCHRDKSYVYRGTTVFNGVEDEYYVFRTRDEFVGKYYKKLQYHEFVVDGLSYSVSRKDDGSAVFCITNLATNAQSVQRFDLNDNNDEIVLSKNFRYDPVGVVTIAPYTIAIAMTPDQFDNKVHYIEIDGSLSLPIPDVAMIVQHTDGTVSLPTLNDVYYIKASQYYLETDPQPSFGV